MESYSVTFEHYDIQPINIDTTLPFINFLINKIVYNTNKIQKAKFIYHGKYLALEFIDIESAIQFADKINELFCDPDSSILSIGLNTDSLLQKRRFNISSDFYNLICSINFGHLQYFDNFTETEYSQYASGNETVREKIDDFHLRFTRYIASFSNFTELTKSMFIKRLNYHNDTECLKKLNSREEELFARESNGDIIILYNTGVMVISYNKNNAHHIIDYKQMQYNQFLRLIRLCRMVQSE